MHFHMVSIWPRKQMWTLLRHQMKTFSRYWPFMRRIQQWPVNFPHKGSVTQALMFSVMLAETKGCTSKWTMMTSSNGNIFRVAGHLCGEFTGPGEFPTQRPVTRSFDVFFDLRLNKRLSKQSWRWWFETPSWSLWRHRNAQVICDLTVMDIGSTDEISSMQCPSQNQKQSHFGYHSTAW